MGTNQLDISGNQMTTSVYRQNPQKETAKSSAKTDDLLRQL
jgi:hypothetical protein